MMMKCNVIPKVAHHMEIGWTSTPSFHGTIIRETA